MLRASMSWLKVCHTFLTPFPKNGFVNANVCQKKKFFGLVIAINWICRSDDFDTFISSDYGNVTHIFLEKIFVCHCRHRKIICIFSVIKYQKVSVRWSGHKRLCMCVIDPGNMKNGCDLSTLANQKPLKQMLLWAGFRKSIDYNGFAIIFVNN